MSKSESHRLQTVIVREYKCTFLKGKYYFLKVQIKLKKSPSKTTNSVKCNL